MTKGADVKAKSNVCACESEEIYIHAVSDTAATSYLCCDIYSIIYFLHLRVVPQHSITHVKEDTYLLLRTSKLKKLM
jgi:hypothetical protein